MFFIPEEIRLDKRLNPTEKMICARICSLSKIGATSGKYCYERNESIADYVGCKPTTVSNTVSKLIELGYVERLESPKGGNRRCRFMFENHPETKAEIYKEDVNSYSEPLTNFVSHNASDSEPLTNIVNGITKSVSHNIRYILDDTLNTNNNLNESHSIEPESPIIDEVSKRKKTTFEERLSKAIKDNLELAIMANADVPKEMKDNELDFYFEPVKNCVDIFMKRYDEYRKENGIKTNHPTKNLGNAIKTLYLINKYDGNKPFVKYYEQVVKKYFIEYEEDDKCDCRLYHFLSRKNVATLNAFVREFNTPGTKIDFNMKLNSMSKTAFEQGSRFAYISQFGADEEESA